MVKKKGRKERSRRRHQDESEEECWSGTERRARLVTRSLHRREWGWSEDGRSVRLDQPGSSWVRHSQVPRPSCVEGRENEGSKTAEFFFIS